MCGRYNIAIDKASPEMQEIFKDLAQQYQDNDQRAELAKVKTAEVARTDTAPVLIMVDDAIRPVLMSFGIPQWDGKGVVANARRETAFEKPMFRKIILDQRCVVPTTGFFEWSHENGKAVDKHWVTHADRSMMYLAGVYGHYKDRAGRDYMAYAVLTADANASISVIHDRMPVILKSAVERTAWLSELGAAKEILYRDDTEAYVLTMVEAPKKRQQKEQQISMF